MLLVLAPALITAATFRAGGPAAVHKSSLVASAEYPTDPEGLSHMGVVVRRAWYKLLSSDARVHLLSGAIAATVSNTIVAPLDVIRLNIMVSETPLSALTVIKQVNAQNGIAGFWRGNSADVARAAPASAIRFYAFAAYKAKLSAATVLPMALQGAASISLIAGGFAGMTAMMACFPLESVRTRMAQVADKDKRNLFMYTANVWRTEGFQALYRGLTPSLISVLPYFAVRFGLYDILKREHQRSTDGAQPSAAATASFGMLAGLAASALTFPCEVARRRAMVGVAGERNPLVAMARIARNEGFFKGLYKGYAINMVKVVPSAAITFYTYEATRLLLIQSKLDTRVALKLPRRPKRKQRQAMMLPLWLEKSLGPWRRPSLPATLDMEQ